MPIVTIQRRARELGRIRIGQKGDKGQPQKLDRFRLTSASKPLIEKVADLYGGTVGEWTPQGGAQQWEVVTDVARIPIMVPPQPVTQFLETWSGGGIVHRCDGETNYLTGDPCDFEDPAHLNAKPTTRLNVVLRDVEGIGVWRLESHGWNAAVELPQAADFLAQAGGYINGWVALEERVSKSEGKTRRFAVPIIEIDVTPAELMAGRGAVAAPQIGGPVAQIEAGPTETGATPAHLVLYYQQLREAATQADCMAIYSTAKAAGHLEDKPGLALYAAIGEQGRALAAAEAPADDSPVEGEVVEDGEDPDVIWETILRAAGGQGMALSDIEAEFAKANGGTLPATASAGELKAFLDSLQARAA